MPRHLQPRINSIYASSTCVTAATQGLSNELLLLSSGCLSVDARLCSLHTASTQALFPKHVDLQVALCGFLQHNSCRCETEKRDLANTVMNTDNSILKLPRPWLEISLHITTFVACEGHL